MTVRDEELAVVADDDDAGAGAGDEPLELVQAGEVEVVGRLVEQQDVVPGQQQGGQPDAGGLPAGQAGHRRVERDSRRDLGDDLLGALLEVGAAEGEPVLERVAVGVVGAGPALGQVVGRGVERGLRGGHPGPPGQRGEDGLPRPPLVLLRQVAERGRRRAGDDGAGLRRELAGQRAQQGGLAGAVHADQTDDVTGGDDQVEAGEQDAGAVSGRQTAGDEGCAHGSRVASRC